MKYVQLLELDTVMSYFKHQFPHTPEFVIQDFIYPNYKHAPNQIEQDIVDWINELSWVKEEITVTLDIFDNFTQNRIQQLLDHSTDSRYKIQQDLLSKNGVSPVPIILTIAANKYELQEGWHRTVESIRKWPNGYKQIAWIGK